jgi:adenylate cyclase
MPDVFLSYNREDQAVARRFAEAFAAEGLDVWWDATLRSGEAYDEVTETALKTAKAVVVLWSPRSAASRWVRAEATLADRNKTLLPVTIEPCERPIMFELTQTAELSHWQGEPADKAWLAFLDDVKRFVGEGAPAAAEVSSAAPSLAARQPDKLSICVLPFANMSNDAEQEYFADGISEDIITDLSKVSALSVISRNSAFTFKGKHVDLPQVARQLGVSHVLEGSVRKAGARVRITAQLIDGATNGHVWADRYDRDLDDIFSLQDEISQAIVAALKLKLFPKEKKAIEDRGTTNTEAFDLYLRARALARTFAPLEILRSIEIYRQALALDPDFALAWTGLASALERALLLAPETQAETRKAMDEAFSRALALDPDGWSNQLSRATQLFAQRDWAGADQAFVRAIEQAPASEPSVRMRYGAFLMHIGRVREGVDLLRSALRAEPLSLEVSTLLQIALDNAGMRAEALAEFERSKDLPGDRAMLEYFAILRLLETKDFVGAKRQFDRFMLYESLVLPVHQEMRDVLDQPEAMLVLLRRAHDDPGYQDSTRQSILAEWAAHYGDFDLAYAAFRRALIDLTATWYVDFWRPHYAVVRRDPRFEPLLRELGLVDYYRSSGKWPDLLRPAGDGDFEVVG